MESLGRRLSPLVVALLLVAGACDGGETTEFPTMPDGEDEGAAVTAAPLPVQLTEVAGAAIDGKIAVAGGLDVNGSAVDGVHLYDPSTDEWAALPRLPVALHHTALVTARGRLFVIGGYTAGPGTAWVESDRVWSLGLDEPVWRAEPSLAKPRGALAADATADGTIVAAGGVTDGSVVATTEILLPGAAGWTGGPALREPREHLAMTVIDGRVFAIAGRVASLESNKRSVESLDPSARGEGWRQEAPLRDARGGTDADGACVAGGEEPSGTISSIECLDRSTGEWNVVASLTMPRHGLAVVALDGALHVISGGDRPGLFVTDTHEVFPGLEP